MTSQPLRLSEAAKVLGTSQETLRRWVRNGCPAVRGGPGRGKTARVDLSAVRAWRASRTAPDRAAHLRELSGIALDFWRRGCEPGAEGQRVIGIPDAKAAAILVFFLGYIAARTNSELRTPESELLEKIALQGNVHAMPDSV